jgi:hypothetical protein
MNQPWQQPNTPSGDPHGPQPGAPGAPGAPGGYPSPFPASRQGNLGLAVLAAVVAMLVGAAIYGFILSKAEMQIGYIAVGVGALIGAALGKLGGQNSSLPFVGIVLGLLGVYCGQVFGISLMSAEALNTSVFDILTNYFGEMNTGLKENLEAVDYLFYILSGAAGFQVTRKLAD